MPPIYAHEQVERLGYLEAVYTETGTHGSEGEVPRIIPGIDSNRGLLHELGEVPGVEVSTETRLQKLEEELQQLRSSIKERDHIPTDSRTEEKLEALNNRVAKLEGALGAIQSNAIASNNRRQYKSSGNPYNQSGRPPQIEALDEQKLALRLNVNIPTLQEKQATLKQTEFEEWSKNRDRGKYMWRFNEKDKLYHPVK
ncbi:MAG: hypothetical protein KI793_32970 [Rivularia sp. (in: Bacteria)]|nr:hypothetical protein [Rivularia sp. MS3]